MAQQAAYAGTGRRKDSVARVRLVPGNGQITINKEDVTKYPVPGRPRRRCAGPRPGWRG